MPDIQNSIQATGLTDQTEITTGEELTMPDSGELLLWAVACGLKPTGGWHQAIRINEEGVKELTVRADRAFARYRLLHTVGSLLDREHIALLLRARLAEHVLNAQSVKDLVEAIRVFEKLPAGGGTAARTAAPTAGPPAEYEPDLSGLDLESALAEARRLLTDLDGDCAPPPPVGTPAAIDSAGTTEQGCGE